MKMAKYKPVKIGTEWSIFREDKGDKKLYQSRPIRYYKTKVSAERVIKKRYK